MFPQQGVNAQIEVTEARFSQHPSNEPKTLLSRPHERLLARSGIMQRVRVEALSIADNARALLTRDAEMFQGRRSVEIQRPGRDRSNRRARLGADRNTRLITDQVGNRPLVRLFRTDLVPRIQREISAVEEHARQRRLDPLDL